MHFLSILSGYYSQERLKINSILRFLSISSNQWLLLDSDHSVWLALRGRQFRKLNATINTMSFLVLSGIGLICPTLLSWFFLDQMHTVLRTFATHCKSQVSLASDYCKTKLNCSWTKCNKNDFFSWKGHHSQYATEVELEEGLFWCKNSQLASNLIQDCIEIE